MICRSVFQRMDSAFLLVAALLAVCVLLDPLMGNAQPVQVELGRSLPTGLNPRTNRVRQGFEFGPIQTCRKPLQKVLRLQVDERRLDLDRRQWKEALSEVEQQRLVERLVNDGIPVNWAARRVKDLSQQPSIVAVFYEIRQSVQANSSYTSIGGSRRQYGFNSETLKGRLTLQGSATELTLWEKAGPMRTLSVRQDDEELKVALAGRNGKMLLSITQKKAGPLEVADYRFAPPQIGRGATFLQYHRGDRVYIQRQLFPLLRHWGFQPPLTGYTPAVQVVVLDLLTSGSLADQQAFAQLLSDLQHDRIVIRESATDRLEKHYGRFATLIHQALAEPKQLGLETKIRLQRVIDLHADRVYLEQFVRSTGLLADVGYLIDLLEDTPVTDQRRQELRLRLHELTGQQFGDQIQQWRQWHESQETQRESSSMLEPSEADQ